MDLTVNLESNQGHTLLVLDGDVNAGSIQLLENALADATRLNNSHILLDCTALNSINSDGLGLLLRCQVHFTGRYYLTLQNVSSDIIALLELSGVNHFIQISTRSAEQQSDSSVAS